MNGVRLKTSFVSSMERIRGSSSLYLTLYRLLLFQMIGVCQKQQFFVRSEGKGTATMSNFSCCQKSKQISSNILQKQGHLIQMATRILTNLKNLSSIGFINNLKIGPSLAFNIWLRTNNICGHQTGLIFKSQVDIHSLKSHFHFHFIQIEE
ncbi:Hypothetical_protein [Hexamita inflata]|uniref:Hypothetical_protein n=1 Tax=Hexamita inflata TaxID=28002 RepID=A0AA86PDK1_9EUKA|nr:Hypothetical protein HINF_LOCUS23138 [Hexamita inflata]